MTTPNPLPPEELARCREAFERYVAGQYGLGTERDSSGEYTSFDTYWAWIGYQAAWSAAQAQQWLPIDDAAKQGQEVLLGGWVNGEWVVMRDDWYVDREMADWREWPAYNDEPPTHYLACPTPPEQHSNGGGE